MKQRPLSGTHALFIVDVSAVRRKQDLIKAESHCRADDRPDVAGILHPIQHDRPQAGRRRCLLRTNRDQPGARHIRAELAHDALAADDRFLLPFKRIRPSRFDQQLFHRAGF